MIFDGFSHWRYLTQWFFDLNWVLVWHSSLGHWSSLDRLGDVLHNGCIEMFAFLENSLLRRRSVMHLRGGHQALENMGWIGFLYGGLELAQGFMFCDSVHEGEWS
jgi:hypothetical protein